MGEIKKKEILSLVKRIFIYQFNIKQHIRKITENFPSIKGKPSVKKLNKEIKLLIPYS